MRGIQFQIPNQFHHFLFQILDSTNVEQYFWNIEEQEIYMPNHKELFCTAHMDGTKFLKQISEHEYYLIFAKILACREREAQGQTDTYAQFLDSTYETVILVSDSTTIEIYSKNQALLQQIKKNTERYSFGAVSWITDADDCRTRFSVK